MSWRLLPACLFFACALAGVSSSAPGDGPETLLQAKDKYDAVVDDAYAKLVAALTQSAVELEAALSSGQDPKGRGHEDLVLARTRIQGERAALEAEGRWPLVVAVATGLKDRVARAKKDLADAYLAAQRIAISSRETKHDQQLSAGAKRYAELNPLAARLPAPDVLARIGVGTSDADWRLAGDAIRAPTVAGPDGAWAPFLLGPGLPAGMIVDIDLVRGPNEGDLLVRVIDEMELEREVTLPRKVVDALCRRGTPGTDRPCRLRVVVTPTSAGIEIEGEDVEEFGTEESGFGLDLSHATAITLRRADKRGPLRVEHVSVRPLPRAPVPNDVGVPTDAAGAGASAASDPCGGGLVVTHAWGEQLGLVREARRRFEEGTDALALDLLKAFKDGIQEYMKTRVLNPNDIEQLRKANARIDVELEAYLYSAKPPREVVSALVRTPLENQYHKAKQQLIAEYDKTESALRLQANPGELASLRDERAEIESYVDLAPWRDSVSENVFQKSTAGLEELLDLGWLKGLVQCGNGLAEWNDKIVRWTAPKRAGPDGEVAPFLVKGELPFEFVFEWRIGRIGGLGPGERLRIELVQDGHTRQAIVRADQILELCDHDASGEVRGFPLRLVVQRDRISVSIDFVRVFCETAAEALTPPDPSAPKVPTELALHREGQLGDLDVQLVRIRPIQALAKRPPRASDASSEPAAAPVEAPRIAPPKRMAQPAPLSAPVERPLAPLDPALGWAEILQREPDPQVIPNDSIRAAMALTELPWRVRERVSGIEMLLVVPGTYQRGAVDGDPDAQPNERPPHRVTLRHPFYVGRYEVQASEWAHVMNGTPSAPGQPGLPWTGAPEAIDGFLARTGGLRLPTEAEWEYACRAWTDAARYAELELCAWSPSRGDGRVHEVGGLAANGFGLHDMLGNVWEWCSDLYDPDAFVSCARGAVDPIGPASGTLRVLRGGSADPSLTDACCRDSVRGSGELKGGPVKFRGLRVARTP